jgi:hypothetical protein
MKNSNLTTLLIGYLLGSLTVAAMAQDPDEILPIPEDLPPLADICPPCPPCPDAEEAARKAAKAAEALRAIEAAEKKAEQYEQQMQLEFEE